MGKYRLVDWLTNQPTDQLAVLGFALVLIVLQLQNYNQSS